MKILFITDNFPPEVNAPATRTYEHAKVWVAQGHEVTVITGVPNFPQGKVYEGYRNKLYQKETVYGINVIRVWTYISANEGFLKRSLDFLSFYASSFFAGLFRKCDVIIATSPQFFTAWSGRNLSFFKRTPWIMEVRDMWPDCLLELDILDKNNPAFRFLSWQEKRCYKTATKVVVVTDSFKERLIEKGVPNDKVAVIKNGVDLAYFKPVEKNREIIENLKLSGKKVVGYIGTHGVNHKLDFILECADALRNDPEIHFLFIGHGAEKDKLLKMKEELALPNVTMLDPVSKDAVRQYISVLDAALINLGKNDAYKDVIPSKIFENASMEIPILLGVEGESQGIIETYNAGLCYKPEDRDDFIKKLYALLNDAELYENFKEGCRLLAKDFDRTRLALNFEEIFADR